MPLSRAMGETTTLALNTPNKASLRTTIPMFIVKQWGLTSGQLLDWSFEVCHDEMVVVVRRVGSSDHRNIVPTKYIEEEKKKMRQKRVTIDTNRITRS